MKPIIIMPSCRRASLIARVIALLTLSGLTTASFATDPNQSQLSAPPGDGWQLLSVTPSMPTAAIAAVNPAETALPPMLATASAPATPTPAPAVSRAGPNAYAVAPVVLPGAVGAPPSGLLTLAITPQDINLRNALDRWLQQQGWQLAWKIDDDLPLEFNATFSGDFDSVLIQVMRATNHMRTPTRVCEHTNNVIRVVARAANCQD
ncbi:toxin co-regulated pilus biosynthesis Q family protein [Paraburkholderia aromaticivorans]|uniref:toxin co-regulated pilus biosynthesis Q family protein n=1 Tax=Paraburkholderia aromaticivorans TaxID=2026199 RepID=UPI0038BBCB47